MELAIPHRPPVLLLERQIRTDVCELTVREGPWLRRGALAPEALVEALAQTCAAWAAHSSPARSGDEVGRGGALAAVSRFEFPSPAVPGDVVNLQVRLQATLGPLAAFEGVARVGERVVARGELRVART